MPFIQYKLVATHNQTREIFNQYIYSPENGDTIDDMLVPGYFDESRYAPKFFHQADGTWYGAVITVRFDNGVSMRQITVPGPGLAAQIVLVADTSTLDGQYLSKVTTTPQSIVSDVSFDGDVSAVDATFTGDTTAVNSTVSGALTLPNGAEDGRVLTTDDDGVASWADAAHVGASGADGRIQFADSGAFASNGGLTWDSAESNLIATNIELSGTGLLRVGGVLASDALENNLTIRGPLESANSFPLQFASPIAGASSSDPLELDGGMVGVNSKAVRLPNGITKGTGGDQLGGVTTVYGQPGFTPLGVPGNFTGVLDVRNYESVEFSESSITGFSNFNTDTALWRIGSTDPTNDHLVIEPYQANSWMILKTGGETRISITDPGDVTIDKQLEVGGRATFLGGVRLGVSGPRIAQLIVTGTMPISQGDSGTIPTGLVDAAHVMSMDAFVTTAANEEVMPSNLTPSAGMSYTITALGTNVFIKTSSSNAGVVVGQPIRILITYLVDA